MMETLKINGNNVTISTRALYEMIVFDVFIRALLNVI